MRTALRSPLLHMAVAFVAMGGWAVLANWSHPMPRPLIAGVMQGSISALITLGLKRMIEWVAARLPGAAAVIGPPVAAVAISAALLTVLHRLAGTPEIARTIAVPLSVTAIYATGYALALRRSRHG
ncbi:MAG: hypothetical protein Q4G25_04320 [Paracoccus sp. (in: a-proteobacteria)]|nr:hypothetical protein [Paracoccus sp. (in: a-proteobacteria)]